MGNVMSIILSAGGGILLAAGFIGTFLPIIPGPPLAWAGLLVCYFSSYNDLSIATLMLTFILAAAVTIADNFLPTLLTKKLGGSQTATKGSTLGLIAGFFAGPAGIILGPFAGAFIGEYIHTGGDIRTSFRTAWGAFLGFMVGTGAKLCTVLIFIWIFIISF